MSDNLSSVAESALNTRAKRLYYMDWLRVLAMLSIFLYHNSRFFDFYGWHVKSADTSIIAGIFVDFCNLWIMPIFFVLAGASVYYALKARSAGGFTRERTLRILIPIIILGWFIISPPQVYLERLTQGGFTGNFFQFYYPHYFDGLYGIGGNFAFVPMHMWFLWLLFIYSLILLPLFLPDKATGKSLASRLATLFQNPWTLIVPVLLIAASEFIFRFENDMMSWGGGWNHLSYLIFFVGGYLIISNERIRDRIRRYAVTALVAGLVLHGLHYLSEYGVIQTGITSESVGSLVYFLIEAFRSWFFILAILGFGSRYLNFNNRFLGYANEAVLPFYILHQTAILIIGFFVLQWGIGILPKYVIITTASFITIMVIYEMLVRRINVLRFLFGMRQKK